MTHVTDVGVTSRVKALFAAKRYLIYQPTRHAAMLKAIGVSVCVVVSAVAVAASGMTVLEVQDSYTCEELDGYDPSGSTSADKYPPDTWAGVCERTKYNATVLQVVLIGGFTIVPGYAIVSILRY